MAWTTGNTVVDDTFATWINKKFVEDLMFELQHAKFTAEAIIPPGSAGNIARYIDWQPPFRNTSYQGTFTATGITEGAGAWGAAGSNEIVSGITTRPTNVTVAEYGEWTRVGELLELVSVPGTRSQIIKRMRDGGALYLDEVVRNQAHNAAATGFYSTTSVLGAQRTVPTAMDVAMLAGAAAIMTMKQFLKSQLVPGIEGRAGHPNKQMAAVLTSKQELDIVTEVTTGRVYWVNAVVNVPGVDGQSKFTQGYIGSIYGTAVYITQNYTTGSVSGITCDVGYVYGADAVAAVALRQTRPEIIVNDVNGPFKNSNSIAWHAYYGATIVTSYSARVVKFYSPS